MTNTPTTAPYTVLHARGLGARNDELLNAGIVLHAPCGPRVAVVQDAARLRALHPDYAAVHLAGWAEALEGTLREHAMTLPLPSQQHALLGLFARPFVPSESMGTATLAADPAVTLRDLMAWLVNTPARTLRPQPATRKRSTRLVAELRQWLRESKVFSTKVEDISRSKVVANYPVLPSADLYADLAVMNGKLHVIETLDLRGVDRLTPSLRGDAAIKGVTLDEARRSVDGRRIAVISASDYQVARPAIGLISRYTDDVWDMHVPADKQKLAEFFAASLHRSELPALHLAT
jgi:hypothetical protein